jgi:hypothetical protein
MDRTPAQDKNSKVILAEGQIRLAGNTFTLEKGTASSGKASIKQNFKPPAGSKFVAKDSDLIIAGKFTVENTSGEQFVTLTNAGIVVETGAVLDIIGPSPPPSGDRKLGSMERSTIEVKSRGSFYNKIYSNWTVDADSDFIFHNGSTITP